MALITAVFNYILAIAEGKTEGATTLILSLVSCQECPRIRFLDQRGTRSVGTIARTSNDLGVLKEPGSSMSLDPSLNSLGIEKLAATR